MRGMRVVSLMDSGVRAHGNPADQLAGLRRRRPYDSEPVRVWVACLEQQVPLWDAIAENDATLAPNAQFVAEHLRRKVKELRENFKPGDRWTGASSR